MANTQINTTKLTAMNGNSIRRSLARIRPLKSAYYLALTLGKLATWSNEDTLARWLDKQYAVSDPWQYRSCPQEKERFAGALRLLDQARDGKQFSRCFEIGCAEGVFTEMLATRCERLIAVDISTAALARARQSVCGVDFHRWNLRRDLMPGGFDLIVLMDVLEMLPRPEIVRAREKVVAALPPGGLLLLGNSRQDAVFETSWWGKWLLCGGTRITDHFAADPRLEVVAREVHGICVNALFRRTTVASVA